MAKSSKKPVPASNGTRIMIVDDEVNVTRTLQMVLEREGYAVVPAYSCAEALKLLPNHSVDVVITDLNMEREDIGLEVARFAKQLPFPPVVIVCTGYTNVDNSREALNMQVDYLITKPADLDELKAALIRLARLREMRNEASAR